MNKNTIKLKNIKSRNRRKNNIKIARNKSRNRRNHNLKISRNKSRNRRKNNYLGGGTLEIPKKNIDKIPYDSVTETETMYYNALGKNNDKMIKILNEIAKDKPKTIIKPTVMPKFTNSKIIPPLNIFENDKKENINIPQNNGVITKNTSIMTGGAPIFQGVYDYTVMLAREFQRIKGFANEQMCSVSLFNPSILKIRETNDEENNYKYYVITTRVIYYALHNIPINKIQALELYREGNALGLWGYPGDEFPENRDFCTIYPGSQFNKWIGKGGFWGWPDDRHRMYDLTMITVIKITNNDANRPEPLMSAVLVGCIDARIAKLDFEFNNDIENKIEIKCYIVGTNFSADDLRLPTKQAVNSGPGHTKSSNIINPAAGEHEVNNGSVVHCNPASCVRFKMSYIYLKICMDRISNLKKNNVSFRFIDNPTYTNTTVDMDGPGSQIITSRIIEHSLGNKITWDINIEKNYAIYYYRVPQADGTIFRRMILNYRLDGPKGIVFYYRDVNLDTNYDLEPISSIGSLDQWNLVEPHNSDIFTRLHHHNRCHYSCTTPFMAAEVDPNDKALFAVGHVKFDMFLYLNNKILQAFNALQIDSSSPERISEDNYNRAVEYYSGRTRGINRDHIIQSGLRIIEWTIRNVVNNPDHGIIGDTKYLMYINGSHLWGNPNTPGGQPHKSISFMSNNYIRQYLILKGFIVVVRGRFLIPRNFHPSLFYYMFIYKINYLTLELVSFSHPFVILKDGNSGALNFPMGITNIGDKICISYGDMDCRCMVAGMTIDKFRELSGQCTNNTPPEDVYYNVYIGNFGDDGQDDGQATAELERQEAERVRQAEAERVRREAEAAEAERVRREAERVRREAAEAEAERVRREAEAAQRKARELEDFLKSVKHLERRARRKAEAAEAERVRREAEAAEVERDKREAEAVEAERVKREGVGVVWRGSPWREDRTLEQTIFDLNRINKLYTFPKF
jgi:hypothetical protein